MIEIEKELIRIFQKLKFRKTKKRFLKSIQQDIKNINNSDKLYVPADKTSNMYKINKQDYDKILTNSITKTYQKAENSTKHKVDANDIEILKDHHIIDRSNINAENNCFITLKDHTENFVNKPTTRLINPAKNELGRKSKVILENINNQLRTNLRLNQWKTTTKCYRLVRKYQREKQLQVYDV